MLPTAERKKTSGKHYSTQLGSYCSDENSFSDYAFALLLSKTDEVLRKLRAPTNFPVGLISSSSFRSFPPPTFFRGDIADLSVVPCGSESSPFPARLFLKRFKGCLYFLSPLRRVPSIFRDFLNDDAGTRCLLFRSSRSGPPASTDFRENSSRDCRIPGTLSGTSRETRLLSLAA